MKTQGCLLFRCSTTLGRFPLGLISWAGIARCKISFFQRLQMKYDFLSSFFISIRVNYVIFKPTWLTLSWVYLPYFFLRQGLWKWKKSSTNEALGNNSFVKSLDEKISRYLKSKILLRKINNGFQNSERWLLQINAPVSDQNLTIHYKKQQLQHK